MLRILLSVAFVCLFNAIGSIAQCPFESLYQDYFENYIGSTVTNEELGWYGNIDDCKEDEISPLAKQKTEQRINYFRRLVGLSDDMKIVDEHFYEAQKAALMMHAGNALDHFPDQNWPCYHEAGVKGAANSNLSKGAHSTQAITGFINDKGSWNVSIGHRRWILYSKAKEFSIGSTDQFAALWVMDFDDDIPADTPEFIAYPPDGMIPAPLVFARWSFGVPGNADLSNIEINISDKDDDYEVFINELEPAFGSGEFIGDNTISFAPAIDNFLLQNTEGERIIDVQIENVILDGETKNYNYQVHIVGLPKFIPHIVGEKCGFSNGSLAVDIIGGFPPYSFEWSNGLTDSILTNLSGGIYTAEITDAKGCQWTYQAFVHKFDKHIVDLGQDHNIKEGETKILEADFYSNATYLWSTGETGIYFITVDEPGEYWVDVQIGDCLVSDTITLSLISNTFEIVQNEQIIAFPNPARDILNIQLDEFESVEMIELYNSEGKTILNASVKGKKEQFSIDLSDLNRGFYILKLFADQKTWTKKLFIQ